MRKSLRFEWDFAKEPGGVLAGGEFKAFSPVNASQFYSVHTGLDIVPPPGYVLRSEPHPRYFTDDTGTVPLAIIGHLQQEWYPRRVFLVFRAPRQGERHIFRKGEPYVQILFVPQRVKYEINRLTEEEESPRRALARAMLASQFEIAEKTWHNLDGVAFSNHYKVMARAFAQHGVPGVKEVVQKAVERIADSFPRDKPIAECFTLGLQRMRESKFVEAEQIFLHILERDPHNATAYNALGVCLISGGNFKEGLKAMMQAAALKPGSADYHVNVGEQLRRLGRLEEAEASFRKALALIPHDQELLSLLRLTMTQRGGAGEAL